MAVEYPVKIKFQYDQSEMNKVQDEVNASVGGGGGGGSSKKGGSGGGSDLGAQMNEMGKKLGVIAAIMASIRNLVKPILEMVEYFVTKGLSELIKIFKAIWEQLKVAWGKLSDTFSELWTGIKEKFQAAWDAFKAGWQVVKDAGTWIWENVVKAGWKRLKQAGAWIWENVIKPAWNVLKTVGAWIMNNIIRPGWQKLRKVGQWVFENIIKPGWETLKSVGVWIWDFLKKSLKFLADLGKKLWDWIKQALSFLADFGKKLWEWFKTSLSFIKDLGSLIWNNVLKPAFDRVADAIGNAVNSIRNAISNIPVVGGLVSSKQFGGTISQTGAHLLHAGERVTTRSQNNGGSGGNQFNITVNVEGNSVNDTMAQEIAAKLRGELEAFGRF